jgi:amino acid adenylation domain-containing protein
MMTHMMIKECEGTFIHQLSHTALVPDLLAAQAFEEDGIGVALGHGAETLTYHELSRRAISMAAHLRSLGVGRNTLVGVCLPRSFDLVVAALAIWKAGGAYVPMDPDYPVERLVFMLDDAQAPVLVTNCSYAQRLGQLKQKVVIPGAVGPVPAETGDRLPAEIAPDDIAYVIYTSGSTGAPKGVEITHGGLANLVAWHQAAFSVTNTDRASHVAGLGFDASVWELWPYLAAGASVHLASDVTRSSADFLLQWLVNQRITIGFIPTPMAERLMMLPWPRNTSLRLLLTGGDTLHHYPGAHLPFALINNYGPTECTVVATSATVLPGEQPDALPPIGRAITNTEIYLLDEDLKPVPEGMPGEMHIGGASLARGYRNRPDLTAEKFIPDPFGAQPGSRLYKTGDIARLLPDGRLAFMGRADDQIKIRGYRIEPNEIVSVLNRRADVIDSLVLAREDTPGDKRLVAYVALGPDSCATHSELREFLRGSVPEYMVPSAFVRLDAFPLTPNGKIDRAALPSPDPYNTLQDEVLDGPQTPTEHRVVAILTDLLKLEDIGRNDNFFMLGGHSLMGAQLIVLLREKFRVELTLRTLFEAPSIAALSAEIDLRTSSGNGSEPQSAAPKSCRSCAEQRS